jgi:LacI family repressor for deo operon, udp, cdd, tsx, nupC, and nupG
VDVVAPRIVRQTPTRLQAFAGKDAMNARIEDVAREAGVSTATVSRALRGLPNVSESTRLTVIRVAANLGYVASRSASRLATGRTMAVAVISPFMERWFYGQAIAAVEAELRQSGFDALLIGLSQPEDRHHQRFDAHTLRGRVDAVIVLTAPLTGAELDRVNALGLPTVYVGASVAGAMSVRIDDVAVARAATEHLLQLGHTRIAYVGGDPRQPLSFTAPADRRAGWMAAMREAGLEPVPAYDVPGHFTATGGRDAADQLLSLPTPPTAVFAASDEMALGVLSAAWKRGLRLPEDLSLVGVDGHELAALLGITSVQQPVARQGALAAQMVLESLRGETRRRHEHVVLPIHIEVRDTTSPTRIPRQAVTKS